VVYVEGCIFCQIAQGKIPSDVVFETDKLIAFRDIHPKSPVHILIIPKNHVNPRLDLTQQDVETLPEIFLAAKEITRKEGIGERGFRLIANVGPESGQEVEHLHFHILGGKRLGPMG